MLHHRHAQILWVIALSACGRDFALPPPPDGARPDFSIEDVRATPQVLHDGTEIQVVFVSPGTVDATTCQAFLGGTKVDCDQAVDRTCTCTGTVPAMAEGSIDVRVAVETPEGKRGEGSTHVVYDATPPTLRTGDIRIERRQSGDAPDRVVVGAGSIEDPATAGYDEAIAPGLTEVRLFDTDSGTAPPLVVFPLDGDPPPASIPALDLALEASDGTPLPPLGRLWIAAVDRAGNVSDPVEIVQGADTEAPSLTNTDLLAWLHVLKVDGGAEVRLPGPPGQIATDDGCGLDRIEILDGAGAGAFIAGSIDASSGETIVPLTKRPLSKRPLPVYWRLVDRCENASEAKQVLMVEEVVRPGTLATPSLLESFDLYEVRLPAGAVTANADTLLDPNARVADASAAARAGDGSSLDTTVDPRAAGTLRWQQATPTVSPPARTNHAMAYDAARGVVVLFGGYRPLGPVADTWIYDGSSWTEVTPASSPPARKRHAMVYDPNEQVVLLFGGIDEGGTPLGDLWAFDGTTWTDRTAAAGPDLPSPRYGHLMGVDPVRGRVFLTGGMDKNQRYDSETWELDPTTGKWSLDINAILGASTDGALACGQAPQAFCLLLEGSITSIATLAYADATWSLATAFTPDSRLQAAMSYDTSLGVFFLFGGRDPSNADSADTWRFDGQSWTQLSLSGPLPRESHAMVYAPPLGRTVLFGGSSTAGTFEADTWELISPVSPTALRAAHLVHLSLHPSHSSSGFLHATARWTGGGSGASGTTGATLFGFGSGWVDLGSTTSPPTSPGTISAPDIIGASGIPAGVLDLYLMVAAPASDPPPGTTPSVLSTDGLEITVRAVWDP